MTLRSTQPLTEISTRCISGGKGGRCVRLTTLPPSCAVVMKSGNLNFLEISGPLQVCNGTALSIYKRNKECCIIQSVFITQVFSFSYQWILYGGQCHRKVLYMDNSVPEKLWYPPKIPNGNHNQEYFNHLTPNGHYIGRTAQLTSRCCILYIYSKNIRTEYFKHAA